MSRYLNHSRHMDYTKDMAEHIYMTEKMKLTDSKRNFYMHLEKSVRKTE